MSATASERLGLTSGHKPVEAGRLSDRLSVVGGSPLQHYRIDGDRFNYGSLFPRPSPIGEANFCMLVNGILRLSTGAFTNIQPVQVSADGGLALEIFEDTHEFDRTVSWLTAIARLRLWMTGAPIPAPERTTIVRPEQNQP
jgi:hypothetical protein